MKILYLMSSFWYGLKYLFLLVYVDLFCDVEKVKKIQYRMLKKQINYAWTKIPFYQKLWKERGFNPEDFKSLADIKKIPFIDKNDVREHFEEMIPIGYPQKRLTLVTTGGTTGMPMQFYIDNYKAWGKEFAFQFFCAWRYFRHKLFFDRVVILRGARINENKLKQGIFWEKSKRDNGLNFSSFHLKNENYKKYLRKIRQYKPKFIKAYPSSIVAFCSMMKEHDDFEIKGLKGVICSSESIYDWQRNLVRETLGVEIYSLYGHSEKSVQALQYLGNKMCFHPLYGYVEFCDIDKNVDVDFGIAHVVCTSFDNDYFPFIRYKTYDYVDVDKSQLYFTHVASRIIGREQDFVYDNKNNKVVFINSDEPLWGIKGIEAYQYVQNIKGELNLLLQINNAFNKDDINIIQLRLKEIYLYIHINIEFVDIIERTKVGKFRYLIQNIK